MILHRRGKKCCSEVEAYRQMKQLEGQGRWWEAFLLCQKMLSGSKLSKEYRVYFLFSRSIYGKRLGHPDAISFCRDVVEAGEGKPLDSRAAVYSNWLFVHNARRVDEKELYRNHLGYAELFKNIKPYEHSRKRRHEKLRVGYLSPDFRHHVMYGFCFSLLANYDHDRFEVYAYSLTEQTDAYTVALKPLVDAWRDVAGMDSRQVAACIHRDEIDILFDLAGHSAKNGLPALSYKPAPVQISGLGYMATTGLAAVDYFLTDDFVDPPETGGQFFVEKLLRVTSQFCYKPPQRQLPPSPGAPCRQRGWLTFGIFNDYFKITDEMLDVWQRILMRVTDSRLLMKSRIYGDPLSCRKVWERMNGRGFPMERVIFEPAAEDYMERYYDVDIALDTYPYVGGGTTCDALYMGVPVITCYSSRRSTRFGYGILSVIGMAELAVASLEKYEDLAVQLAQDEELLDSLHRILRSRMLQTPLMDGQLYMRDIESGYEQIWQDFEEA